MRRLLASDISTRALKTASAGVYPFRAVDGVPAPVLKSYFERGLGADAGKVRGMVLGEAMALVIGGTLVGLPLALMTARLLRNQLYGVELVDPPSIIVALVVLALSAALAGYLPATRAARVGPLEALRTD